MFSHSVLLCCVLAVASSLLTSEEEGLRGRIMGGTIGRHDAVASIRSSMLQGNMHICGAFIINNQWIGTAAQCVHGRTPSNTIVGVGTNLITPTVTHALCCIHTHELFNPTTLANDIALVRTVNPIVFGATTTSISLDLNTILTAVDVEVFGWGRSNATDNFQNVLMRGVFRTVPLQQCRDSFPTVMRHLIQEEHICSAWTARATCLGDSGGPMIFDNRVIGIVSWVEPCAEGQVNVNTRISSYITWIIGILFP